MVYIKFKHIKSKAGRLYTYVYACKSRWIKKYQQPRQTLIKCLGKIYDTEPSVIQSAFEKCGARCVYCKTYFGLNIQNGEVVCEKCQKQKELKK